jgi:hypothetical protein
LSSATGLDQRGEHVERVNRDSGHRSRLLESPPAPTGKTHCRYGYLMGTETANEQSSLRVLSSIRRQLQLGHLRRNEQRADAVAQTDQAVHEHQAAF